jgi:hypothetical protein
MRMARQKLGLLEYLCVTRQATFNTTRSKLFTLLYTNLRLFTSQKVSARTDMTGSFFHETINGKEGDGGIFYGRDGSTWSLFVPDCSAG